MTNEEQQEQIIETIDEQGNIIRFELFDIVEVDEQEYALLLPVETEEEEQEELVLMRLTKDGEDYLFETISDDAEFDKVAAYVESLEDEEDDE
jgi:putative Holliday junction resolvase